MTADDRRIAAVVVTFNRLELLRRLVAILSDTEGLDEVLVVDNASTDGTGEWLRTAADGSDRLHARLLTDNTGGAGGFHEGLRWAVERGADLVWLMDDDGMPEPGCLETLLTHDGALDFWGPVVVDETDRERLVFPIRLPGGARVVHAMGDVRAAATDGVIRGIVIPFNGVLVTRALVEDIGLPRAEFFLWGDDHEYRLRAERSGARIGTVVDARVRHPSVGALGTPMAFGRTTYNHTPSDLKHYCMARNNLLNLREYGGRTHAAAFVAKTLWFYAFTRRDPGRIRLSLDAWRAARRGDFSGHERFLRTEEGSPTTAARPAGRRETVAVVVVTFNRADLLGRMLDGLAASTHEPDAVIVVDNASEDHTRAVLDAHVGLKLQRIHLDENTGGAGGFRAGVEAAYEQGFDRIWLMDDDVVPAPDCLALLMAEDEACVMSVREDVHGRLVEKAATDFDLRHPWSVRPKRRMVETDYGDRHAMPRRVELHNVAFEGFLFRREVVDAIGPPDSSYFIFYDDVDFALRARRAGYRIWAVRDAVLVRQLDFSQQHDLAGWKGYYMYRNLFAVHFRYGENALVRAKPFAIAAAVVALSPMRGGRAEAGNVIHAMRSARGMRSIPGSDPAPR